MNKIYNFSKILSKHSPKSGFGAAIALILLSLTSIGLALSVLGAAVVFSDMTYRHELRIQQGLNEKTCADIVKLIKAKDVFASGKVYLKDFGCVASL